MKNRERFRENKRNKRNDEKLFINCFILAFCSSNSGLFRNWVWNFYIINNRMREILVCGITKLFKNQYSTAPINMDFIDEYWFDKLQYYHWILTVSDEYRWFKYPLNDENVRSYLSKISNVQHEASKNFCRGVSVQKSFGDCHIISLLFFCEKIRTNENNNFFIINYTEVIYIFYYNICILFGRMRIEYLTSNIEYQIYVYIYEYTWLHYHANINS